MRYKRKNVPQIFMADLSGFEPEMRESGRNMQT